MIPPDEEIYQVEKRIAERRHRVEAAARASARQALRALTSPWALAGAATIGFLVAGGLHRRHPAHPVDRRKKQAAKASTAASLAMAAASWIIKSQFGSPVGMAQYFLARLKKQPSSAAASSSRGDRIPATTRP